MPALNFKRQFAHKIFFGTKIHTIRKPRKSPLKKGDTLFLYTGMRTKKCQKIITSICESVNPIHLDFVDNYIHIKGQSGVYVINKKDQLDFFAVNDGFRDWEELCGFFKHQYQESLFSGELVAWKLVSLVPQKVFYL